MFRSRIINVLVGCVVGLVFLLVGGSSEWKLPLALAVTVLVSSYVIHIQTMWRQAPITAAIVIAAGLTPPLQAERGGARPAQGRGGAAGLRDGTVRELDHVPGLAIAGGAGQGRVEPRRRSLEREAVTGHSTRCPPSTSAAVSALVPIGDRALLRRRRGHVRDRCDQSDRRRLRQGRAIGHRRYHRPALSVGVPACLRRLAGSLGHRVERGHISQPPPSRRRPTSRRSRKRHQPSSRSPNTAAQANTDKRRTIRARNGALG